MPRTIEQSSDDRIATSLELIVEKLDDLIDRETSVNVNVPEVRGGPVNVNVPDIHLPPAPAPVISVDVPPFPRSKKWVFTVHRDSNGLIETITAEPRT